jgi:anti-anti-sigma regulatory factor
MTREPEAWGVRLERVGRAIVVAPAGRFDTAEVQRLRDVLESRQGAYESVVVDLRDVFDVGEPGLKLLLDQQEWAREQGIELAVVPGPAAQDALARIDAAQRLVLVEDIEAVLAPHRADWRNGDTAS